jgi:hypothetical protein
MCRRLVPSLIGSAAADARNGKYAIVTSGLRNGGETRLRPGATSARRTLTTSITGKIVNAKLLAVLFISALLGCANANAQCRPHINGYNGPLKVDWANLPMGAVGAAYHGEIHYLGGTPPYHVDIPSGALPPGLVVSDVNTPNGSGGWKDCYTLISGTPTAAGVFAPTDLRFVIADKRKR